MEELPVASAAASHAQALDLLKPMSVLFAGQSGYTPLLYAARAGHVAAVQVLLAHGAQATARCCWLCVFLRLCIENKRLLRSGAKVNSQTKSSGASALHRAAYVGHAPVVQLLCARNSAL